MSGLAPFNNAVETFSLASSPTSPEKGVHLIRTASWEKKKKRNVNATAFNNMAKNVRCPVVETMFSVHSHVHPAHVLGTHSPSLSLVYKNSRKNRSTRHPRKRSFLHVNSPRLWELAEGEERCRHDVTFTTYMRRPLLLLLLPPLRPWYGGLGRERERELDYYLWQSYV